MDLFAGDRADDFRRTCGPIEWKCLDRRSKQLERRVAQNSVA